MEEVAFGLCCDGWIGSMELEERFSILYCRCRPLVTWEVAGWLEGL